MRILLKGVRILGGEKTNILIDKGRISKISSSSVKDVDKSIDLDGAVVLPSLCDIHSHCRQPQDDEKETIESFSQAAVHGGVTIACTMPNTSPVVDSPAIVSSLIAESKRVGLIDLFPVASLTIGQRGNTLVEMAQLKRAGAIAVSEDGKSVASSRLMRSILEYAKTLNLLVMLHCEDIDLSLDGVMNEGDMSLELGLKGIPEISETIGILRDLEIATYVGARVHICHISLARSVRIIREYKRHFSHLISCETTPHYLVFDEKNLSTYNTSFKVNPPLRTERDKKALFRALKTGVIDCIATDHAPHTDWEKELEFDRAPFGISGIETWLSCLVHFGIKEGIITWQEIKRWCCDTPRRILRLEQVDIAEGNLADLVVIDPERDWLVSEGSIYSKGKNTPFMGQRLYGKVLLTLKGGKIVFSDV